MAAEPVGAGDPVRVVYRKYDGALHWHQRGTALGHDEHGAWVGFPAGTEARRGCEPAIVVAQPHVMLFPPEGWWTAVFNGGQSEVLIYCDISTVPTWTDGMVIMVDLDLDVARFRADGRVEILDEDEFAEHRVRYGYPTDVIIAAESATHRLAEAIRAGAEPFATTYRAWLDTV